MGIGKQVPIPSHIRSIFALLCLLEPCLCLLIVSAPGPYQGGTIAMSGTYSVVFGMEA